ncbi:unnamed protein product [Anisakis simplex]|uniref:SH3 domain-containing protein n=1 Tax=Anisakis simplex TaxID=6269 RepID=A0A3P6QHM6_ANISI|nr:unnamed protein product [Anisakis simplex]
MLSFKKGDVIQIITRNDTYAPLNGNWLYGKIGNQYGNLPANYVQPLDTVNRDRFVSLLLPYSYDRNYYSYSLFQPDDLQNSDMYSPTGNFDEIVGFCLVFISLLLLLLLFCSSKCSNSK